ncbi:HSP20-like chaperones superfamily protein [Striga hermonthica]|uniref:Co-chaperone protein p23 n=1 Tax=Striga hermonthica TaxID=68872 RepID=A0A9N7NDP9_STRHE|nr:HSP20-like chaperones superfamily protein [Striga hermonthica]
MSRHPEVKWAEREDKVYLTVLLPDAKNPKVGVDPDGTFTFSAAAGSDNNLYEVKLNLLDKVNVEESKINIGVRNIFCVLEKAEKKWWTKLLRGDEKTPHYVKVDWDKWVDEDDDTGAPSDLDLDGMDFSKFGDMGGMGGMGDMSGLGGMGGFGDNDAMGDDFEDSDDDEEIKKPEVKGADKAEGEAPKDKAETAPTS